MKQDNFFVSSALTSTDTYPHTFAGMHTCTGMQVQVSADECGDKWLEQTSAVLDLILADRF